MAALSDAAETAPSGTGAELCAREAQELAALRTIASHNMRLLKAQILPLIDAALRSSTMPGHDSGAADCARRWTETALRLIDDTAIAAVAGASGGAVSSVDFRAELQRAAGPHGNRIGPVTLGALPRLLARQPYLRLLADEILAGVARIAPRQLPGGLLVGCTPDAGSGAEFWLRARDLPTGSPAQAAAPAAKGDRNWSVCCNLMARMGGSFHVSATGRGRLSLALRFPGDMVLTAAAG